jgi:hypothetical protein
MTGRLVIPRNPRLLKLYNHRGMRGGSFFGSLFGVVKKAYQFIKPHIPQIIDVIKTVQPLVEAGTDVGKSVWDRLQKKTGEGIAPETISNAITEQKLLMDSKKRRMQGRLDASRNNSILGANKMGYQTSATSSPTIGSGFIKGLVNKKRVMKGKGYKFL